VATILVIGSNSFSGSSLIKSLLTAGLSVVAVSRREEVKALYNQYSNLTTESNFNFYQIDLNSNENEISNLCKKHNVNTVINFSAQSMVGESWINPDQWYQTNVVSLSKLISSLRINSIKLDKFIQFTTPEVYGNTTGLIKENFNFMPTTPYAISRAAGDLHLKAMFDNFDFPVIFTRAANVYGEHQSNYRILPKTFILGLTGKKLPLHGGGSSERSFIHIDDVSSALMKIIAGGEVGNTYHISTDRIVTIKKLVEMCCSIMNLDFEDFCQITEDRAGKDAAYKLDSTHIRSKLLWSDEISLEDGLSRTYDWVAANLNEILMYPLDYQHRR
jgi:dTDP-glucose 4,6-dehydratase